MKIVKTDTNQKANTRVNGIEHGWGFSRGISGFAMGYSKWNAFIGLVQFYDITDDGDRYRQIHYFL